MKILTRPTYRGTQPAKGGRPKQGGCKLDGLPLRPLAIQPTSLRQVTGADPGGNPAAPANSAQWAMDLGAPNQLISWPMLPSPLRLSHHAELHPEVKVTGIKSKAE